jgi:hypothetical protein
MNEVIYKYRLNLGDNAITLREAAQVLTAQMQGDALCLWVKVDLELPEKIAFFEVVGTGQALKPRIRRHIATVQSGLFVWHIFKREL